MVLLDYLLIVLVVVAIAVLVLVMRTLLNLNKVTANLEQDVAEIKEKVLPALDNLEETLANTAKITSRLEKRTQEVDEEIGQFVERVSGFKDKFESYSTENPLTDFIKRILSLKKGFTAFWSNLRNR